MRTCSMLLVSLWLFVAPAIGQSDDYKSGLLARYEDSQGRRYSRVDSVLSHHWDAQPAAAGLNSGPISVKWTGYLRSQNPGNYQLAAYVRGKITIKLNGQVILSGSRQKAGWVESKPLPLEFDFHPLQVEYSGTASPKRISLFWSGPNFQREPIPPTHYHHDAEKTIVDDVAAGQALVRAYRCAACHVVNGQPEALPAPSLQNVSQHLHAEWMVDHVQQKKKHPSRRMPYFKITSRQATQLVAYLRSQSKPTAGKRTKATKKPGKKKDAPSATRGAHLFASVGCLACHQMNGLGEDSLFAGGELNRIAVKRPASFFDTWLSDPQSVNANHRMPVFQLTSPERKSLALYLAAQGRPAATKPHAVTADDIAAGKRLFADLRCNSCHTLNTSKSAKRRERLSLKLTGSDQGCLDAPAKIRPGYLLAENDRRLVRRFLKAMSTAPAGQATVTREQLLRESGCVSCHSSHQSTGIARFSKTLSKRSTTLANLAPALAPPSLISVGDKLHDKALADMIRRPDSPHRPWLAVRMPKFRLSDKDIGRLVQYFVTNDRVPEYDHAQSLSTANPRAMAIAGRRLVTTDGFGCTSCHQVGSVYPPKAPLNARGPTLSMMKRRIRKSWFDRWVRNPVRIVPRMEMPSVQIPVRGVLNDHLDTQLDAVWQVLNQPGFQPPPPGAVRTVRHSGLHPKAQPTFLSDVTHLDGAVFTKPLIVALPNRHNLVFDLATARLLQWTIGDAAKQRTKGKTWFWTLAGYTVAKAGSDTARDLSLEVNGVRYVPRLSGQFATEFDSIDKGSGRVAIKYRLRYAPDAKSADIVTVQVVETIVGFKRENGETGFQRELRILNPPSDSKFRWRGALQGNTGKPAVVLGGEWKIDGNVAAVRPSQPADEGAVTFRDRLLVEYRTRLAVDTYPPADKSIKPPPATTLKVAPGFQAIRLPLAAEIMPTGMAWRANGDMFITSLKGRVWSLRDTDGDKLEDRLALFSDELAAPFGAVAGKDYVDVVNKYSLIRLRDRDKDGKADHYETLSSGWGHTTDYHDWAVGMPVDQNGNYYVALSCQQDDRSRAAAALRGEVLRLMPRTPTEDNPQRFEVQRLTAGHRFPVGIARSRGGQLFVTDNQGNYNPFNELNHVVPGRRYGFINKNDRKKGFNPLLTEPAINIPHPWTRSVNGICFLETPSAPGESKESKFGPFEGHLIGCEYDTRRLIRMSLQKVKGEYQGAAYPFSYDKGEDGKTLLGPLTCNVSPAGDLYVGCIRDSGWGGANNIGSIVRLRPDLDSMPCGIAEVRATPAGFEIKFTADLDRKKAGDRSNFLAASYRRISTPAYGGKDVDRRVEKVAAAKVVGPRTVRLSLGEMRKGFVYELRLKNVGLSKEFYPAEAYYSLQNIPK